MQDLFVDTVAQHRPFLRDCAVHAAHVLGLFDALAGATTRLPLLAVRLGLPSPHRLAALIDVLRLEGVVQGPADALRVAHVPASPPPPPAAGWGLIARVLSEDCPLDTRDTEKGAWQRHMLDVGARTAPRLLAALAPISPGATLLDLGCGLGPNARAFLEAAPDRLATLVDHPEVLAALDLPAALRPRATLRPADLLAAPLLDTSHDTFDIVLLSHVLHLFDPTDARDLCQRAIALARPGTGRVVVRDFALAPNHSGPATSLYFALNMALYTARGTVHAPDTIAAWLGEGGGAVRVERFEDWPDIALVTAERQA